MELEYLWCYQVEKESYLSKLVERNKEMPSLIVAVSFLCFLMRQRILKYCNCNSIVILALHLYFHRLDFSAESGKVMSKKTEFVR